MSVRSQQGLAMMKEWRCVCGEWVSFNLPEHRHAFLPTLLGHISISCEPTVAPIYSPWTFKRTKDSPTRERL